MRKLLLLLILSVVPTFAQAAHNVVLNWTWSQGTGGTGTGFNILRGTTTGGPYAQISTISSITTLTYTDISGTGNILTEGSSYYYVIQAVGPGGTSPNSPEAKATIPYAVPINPNTLTATPH